MASLLPTGITVLDRRLDGGIPAGSVVALCASPASQAELFLYELTAARRTLYLSLDRTEHLVREGLDNAATHTGDPTIRYVSAEDPLDSAARHVRSLPTESNLIIDPFSLLEDENPARYRNFFNKLQNHITNTGSIAMLHCLDGLDVSPLRDTTLHMADIVFHLETEIKGDRIENRMAVPKFRGGSALSETIKLELSNEVTVDTSRDIA